MIPLTRQEFLDRGGAVCPTCRSILLAHDEPYIDDASAWRETECKECGEVWESHYVLTSFTYRGDES